MSIVSGSMMCSAPSGCADELQAIDNVVSGTEASITPSSALLKLPYTPFKAALQRAMSGASLTAFALGSRRTYSQVPDIPAMLARCLDGLASCTQRSGVDSEVAACNQASACSAATWGAAGNAETLWVRACCALLERAAPAARPGSLLQQARSLCIGWRGRDGPVNLR